MRLPVPCFVFTFLHFRLSPAFWLFLGFFLSVCVQRFSSLWLEEFDAVIFSPAGMGSSFCFFFDFFPFHRFSPPFF